MIDLFKLLQDKVAKILEGKGIEIDYTDDDTFADFMADIGDEFDLSQKQALYTYNWMLQSLAFDLEVEGFYMKKQPI